MWVADAQIRNAAESIASGMRYAQSQAIARNSTIEFVLDPTVGTGGWTAQQVDASRAPSWARRCRSAILAGGRDLAASPSCAAGATKVQFSILGVIAGQLPTAAPTLTQVQITSATGVAGARNLNVLVGGGASGIAGQAARTGIKICDPKWPATDPKGCPA